MDIRCFCLLLCLFLPACSGNGSDSAASVAPPAAEAGIEDPVTRSLAATSGSASNPSATFDEDAGLFSMTALGVDVELGRFPVADYGALLAMRDATGLHNAYFGEGQGTQLVIYSGGTAGNVGHLSGFTRVGATEMPLDGAAQFTGDYAGFTTTRRINGKAQLDVDFAASTVGGRITERIFRQRPDNVADVVNPLSDVILEVTELRADGTFQGVTGGGQIVNGQALWNPATGSYAGLIGGPNGGESVGTLALEHRAPNGSSFEELGGFLVMR